MFVDRLAKAPRKLALQILRHELHEWQVVMGFDGIPEVRGRDEPSLAYPLHLPGKAFNSARTRKVFQYRVRVDNIEGLVSKWQSAPVKHYRCNTWETLPVVCYFLETKSSARNFVRVWIPVLELLTKSNTRACDADIEDTGIRLRAQELREQSVLLLSRPAVKFKEKSIHAQTLMPAQPRRDCRLPPID